jgi:hypothetical protein
MTHVRGAKIVFRSKTPELARHRTEVRLTTILA